MGFMMCAAAVWVRVFEEFGGLETSAGRYKVSTAKLRYTLAEPHLGVVKDWVNEIFPLWTSHMKEFKKHSVANTAALPALNDLIRPGHHFWVLDNRELVVSNRGLYGFVNIRIMTPA